MVDMSSLDQVYNYEKTSEDLYCSLASYMNNIKSGWSDKLDTDNIKAEIDNIEQKFSLIFLNPEKEFCL